MTLTPNVPIKVCFWCDKPHTIFQMMGQGDKDGNFLHFMCNGCILRLTGMFLRGRHEYELAAAVEKFIGHKLPFEVE